MNQKQISLFKKIFSFLSQSERKGPPPLEVGCLITTLHNLSNASMSAGLTDYTMNQYLGIEKQKWRIDKYHKLVSKLDRQCYDWRNVIRDKVIYVKSQVSEINETSQFVRINPVDCWLDIPSTLFAMHSELFIPLLLVLQEPTVLFRQILTTESSDVKSTKIADVILSEKSLGKIALALEEKYGKNDPLLQQITDYFNKTFN